MNGSDAYDREKEIFGQALEAASPAERQAVLERACGHDGALLGRLQALVAAHESADRFLPAQPAAFGADMVVSEKPGDRIGRYLLCEKIGEGGCGAVYVAEQAEPVRRMVALKVIKLGMDTRSVVARFNAERQALAMMDHPNIAKVLDAGATDTGRPYFVMELVRGVKITDYCDNNQLSTNERLELFIKTCQGVQHAHQKGIIHRDLKPSNILVTVNDGEAIPKVIDFGIAKATEGKLTDMTVYTEMHQFLGTPAYMSPEQASMCSMDIDTRSDVYSLGVLLYELMTSRTPFETRELAALEPDELRRVIREKEPARPSTRLNAMQPAELAAVASQRGTEPPRLVRLLRGDLDWIVMKCLEKDRARRYATVNGLATDVQRHLDSEPVVARPPGAGYRLFKALRRHRTTLTVAALTTVVVLLLAGTGLAVWEKLRPRKLDLKVLHQLSKRLGDSPRWHHFVFDNFNTNGVYNRPPRATVVVFPKETWVSEVITYHWNNGRGAPPGNIAIYKDAHWVAGGLDTIGAEGAGGVSNAQWIAQVAVVLPPGSYTIVDSDASTWSWNTNSQGMGFVRVSGAPSD